MCAVHSDLPGSVGQPVSRGLLRVVTQWSTGLVAISTKPKDQASKFCVQKYGGRRGGSLGHLLRLIRSLYFSMQCHWRTVTQTGASPPVVPVQCLADL